ncbi:hypothetical protein [Chromobacterium piscinae]|uniref:hypothetical protein n=1 Tax=Chromobacterium piscinae TaxID=686831 RepID=UPI003F80F7C5
MRDPVTVTRSSELVGGVSARAGQAERSSRADSSLGWGGVFAECTAGLFLYEYQEEQDISMSFLLCEEKRQYK